MVQSRNALEASAPQKRYVHLIGMCLLLGTSTTLFSVGLIRSSTSTVSNDYRRLLTQQTRVWNATPDLMFPSPLLAPSSPPQERRQLDFFVAGFPKCGTTTMLYAFANHNETVIGTTEECITLNTRVSDMDALNRLDYAVAKLNSASGMKRGIKCPSGIKNARSLERLHNHSPRAKLVIGIRHPVLFFQSYYNYRVTEIHDRNLKETIPPAETLIGKLTWKDVCTDTARFDLYLKQLGKTNMTTSQMEEFIGRPHMAVRPNMLKVFLYTLDQIDDRNKSRATTYRSELQEYLDLRSPIPPFSHENLNHFVGDKAHSETMDICQPRYDALRRVLVGHGVVMETWIRKEFIKSPDVVVANKKHFLDSIRAWRSDPCLLKINSVQ